MIKSLQMLAGILVLTTLVGCGGGGANNTVGSTPGAASGTKVEVTSIKPIVKDNRTYMEVTFKNTGTKALTATFADIIYSMGSKEVYEHSASISSTISPGESKSTDTNSSTPDPKTYNCYQYKITAYPVDYSETYKYTSAPVCP